MADDYSHLETFWGKIPLVKSNTLLKPASIDFQIFTLAWAFYLENRKSPKNAKEYQHKVITSVKPSDIDWDKAEQKARRFIESGQIKILKLFNNECPFFVFAAGSETKDIPYVAFFNSRVPRTVKPDSDWLKSLKYALDSSKKYALGYITSSNHLPYEIVDFWARKNQKPIIKVEPNPIKSSLKRDNPMLMSCCIHPFKCDRKTMMKCRDRIIANISDVWVIVKLRKASTLTDALIKAFQKKKRPVALCNLWSGNKELSKEIPDITLWNLPFHERTNENSSSTLEANKQDITCYSIKTDIPWNEFLYHYTRSSFGPMKNESKEDYIARLLKNDPLISNTALDVLINLARNGTILASGKMIKGGYPVVSLTSIPPTKISGIKKWNKAAIRWTVENYGIAIRKDLLKKLGAKPVCYIPPEDYSKLPHCERYRYQKHQKPSSLWKHEREWRILGNINLKDINSDSAFWFVSKRQDVKRFKSFVTTSFPIIVLEDFE